MWLYELKEVLRDVLAAVDMNWTLRGQSSQKLWAQITHSSVYGCSSVGTEPAALWGFPVTLQTAYWQTQGDYL